MKKTRVFIVLFLGILIAVTTIGAVTSSAAAQQVCTDPQTGKQIPCPQPGNPGGGNGGGGGRRKPTKTPYPSYTPTPTQAVLTPEPYPDPYPGPGSYPGPGPYPHPTISPTIPPYGLCVFCDRPWLWGLGGIVIVLLLGAAVFRFFTGGVGPGPDPGPDNLKK